MASQTLYTVKVSREDQSEISKLPLNRDALGTALLWPLRTMFRAPYTEAILHINNQGQVVDSEIKWQQPASEWDANRQRYYMYKLHKREVLKNIWGLWAAFNTDGTVNVYNSASAAKAGATDDNAYVVMIGSEEMSILFHGSELLLEFELPDDHDVYPENRTVFEEPQEASFQYVANTRRWMTITLQYKSDGRWRKEHFLLDSGAPGSYLLRPELFNTRVRGQGNDLQYELELLGVPVVFRPSGQCANKAVKNINLLGVDFMNNFTVIDDKIVDYLLLLRRPNPTPYLTSLPQLT